MGRTQSSDTGPTAVAVAEEGEEKEEEAEEEETEEEEAEEAEAEAEEEEEARARSPWRSAWSLAARVRRQHRACLRPPRRKSRRQGRGAARA